jgi:hypothetical protein
MQRPFCRQHVSSNVPESDVGSGGRSQSATWGAFRQPRGRLNCDYRRLMQRHRFTSALVVVVVGVALGACGVDERDDATMLQTPTSASVTSTTFAPAPDPPSITALDFVQRAVNGEDVTALAVDFRVINPQGDRVPAPQIPAELAAKARELESFRGTVENAPTTQVRLPDGTIRELASVGFGPGCAIPADIHVYCSVIIRSSLATALINVVLLTRRATQREWAVADVMIIRPLIPFTR